MIVRLKQRRAPRILRARRTTFAAAPMNWGGPRGGWIVGYGMGDSSSCVSRTATMRMVGQAITRMASYRIRSIASRELTKSSLTPSPPRKGRGSSVVPAEKASPRCQLLPLTGPGAQRQAAHGHAVVDEPDLAEIHRRQQARGLIERVLTGVKVSASRTSR